MAEVQTQRKILTLAEAHQLIDRLSDHNVTFANQAERLEKELSKRIRALSQ